MVETGIVINTINIFFDEADKGNLHELVLFLRVEAVKPEAKELVERFSLHLDMQADIQLPE